MAQRLVAGPDGAVRLRVPPAFALPRLRRLPGVRASVPLDPSRGSWVVADTSDLALRRWGARLVHDGDAWQLRLPPHPAGAVSPRWHRTAAQARTVPAAFARALVPLVGERDVARVARLAVRRTGVVLLDDDGDVLLQVGDEEVSVHAGRRLTGRFREVVLVPGPAARPKLLRAVEEALLDAGALGRDDQDRTARVLGPAPAGLPDTPAPPTRDVAAAWSAGLRDAVERLAVVSAHLRLDATGAVAGDSRGAVAAVAGLAGLLDAPADATGPLDQVAQVLAELEVLHAVAGATADVGAPVLHEAVAADTRRTVRRLRRHLDGEPFRTARRELLGLVASPALAPGELDGPLRASVATRLRTPARTLLRPLDATPTASDGLVGLAAGAALSSGKAPARLAAAATAAAAAARAHERTSGAQRRMGELAADLAPTDAFLAGTAAGALTPELDAARAAWVEALPGLTRRKATRWLQPDDATPDATPHPGAPPAERP